MTFIEAVKGGFSIVNRNWQLVLIQLCMVFLSSIGFFIIVGIPLAIAFIIFGIDLTELANVRDVFRLLEGPADFISKYFGLIIIIIASVLVYILLVALLGIYVFSGAVGVITRSLKDSSMRFHIRIFFEEAKRLFLRLLGFTSVIAIIFIICAFLLGILGGGIAILVSFARSQDSTLALFFGSFFSLILIILAIILILSILSATLYGIAALSFRGTGAIRSLKEAVQFLFRYPNAFWLYSTLFAGYLLASFLVILIGYPFTLIPIVGPILSFPYQLISSAFETYLGLMIFSTVFSYYYATEIAPEPAEPSPENPEAKPAGEKVSSPGQQPDDDIHHEHN
jgi:hypothetical protein